MRAKLLVETDTAMPERGETGITVKVLCALGVIIIEINSLKPLVLRSS